MKVGESEIQGHPWLHREFEASLPQNKATNNKVSCELQHTSIIPALRKPVEDCQGQPGLLSRTLNLPEKNKLDLSNL